MRVLFFSFIFTLNCATALNANEKKTNTLKTIPSLSIDKILSMTIDSSINPATLNYLESGYERASKEGFKAVLIKLDTPGGLVSTTKEIITLIGKKDILTIIWVTPEGASATSAGAIIASSAHFLVMSQGTNIGAATPIQMSSDMPKDARSKAINDLMALVKSLSESRGRNQDAFGEMIENAKSYKAQEAFENNIIDGIVNDQQDLFKQLSERKVITIKGKASEIKIASPTLISHEMDLGQKLLNILANPNLAYILFLIGAALLYLEFQAPGGFIAGSIGAVCLLLSGIGFQILPVHFGALGLLILAFIMFILEAYITSYGILSIAGLGTLLAGSLFLFRTDEAYLSLSHSLIFTAVGTIGLFLLLMGVFVFRDFRKNKLPKNIYSLVGKEAKIVMALGEDGKGNYTYKVKISGEIWKARSQELYKEGESCEIKENTESMTLII